MSWAEDRAAPGDGDCKHVWPWMRATKRSVEGPTARPPISERRKPT